MRRLRPTPPGRRSERGQALVLFTLVLVVILAMAGLVVDGGDTFNQRRDMQNAADAAAMAAGYAFANTSSSDAATAAAQGVAASNGYTIGVGGVTMSVSTTANADGSTSITVDLGKPHDNYFAGVVGQPVWQVGTTATVEEGVPNGAYGAMPIIFNKKALAGNPFGQSHNRAFGEPGTGTEDVPQDASTFNWTVFCTAHGNPCNGDSNTVDDLINGGGTSTIVTLKELIGPLNAGSHTTLFSDLSDYVGQDFPVAIVDDAGAMVGWAMFRLTACVGGSTKQLSGYFESPINPSDLHVVQNGNGTNGVQFFGAYSVRLTN